MNFPTGYNTILPKTGFRYMVNESGRIVPMNYKGQPCKNCKCATCNKRLLCAGLVPGRMMLGDAKSGTKLTPSSKSGQRAKSFIQYVGGLKSRTAGGTYIGNNDLVDFVQQVASMPIDVAKTVLQYATTPGLVYSMYNEGKKLKSQIQTKMANDPAFKKNVENTIKKITNLGTDVFDTIWNPIKSTSMTISMMPYIIVGVLVIAAIFAFKNPGSVSLPSKISYK